MDYDQLLDLARSANSHDRRLIARELLRLIAEDAERERPRPISIEELKEFTIDPAVSYLELSELSKLVGRNISPPQPAPVIRFHPNLRPRLVEVSEELRQYWSEASDADEYDFLGQLCLDLQRWAIATGQGRDFFDFPEPELLSQGLPPNPFDVLFFAHRNTLTVVDLEWGHDPKDFF